MCPVLPSSSHSSDADFARTISRRFAHGGFLIVGANSQELERQFAEVKRDAVVMWAPGDLMMRLGQGEIAAHWELLLIDDGSSDPELLRALRALAARDLQRCLERVYAHAA
jgi:hypothetical protein